MNKRVIESFDFVKAFACIFIVLIHCRFPGYIGNIFRTIAKFGVPFFFMIAGYFFLYGKEHYYDESKTKKKIIHIIKIIIVAELFYFLFTIFMIKVMNQVYDYKEIFNIYNIAKLVIANSPLIYSHLWFLGALLYCYIFSWVMKNHIRGVWKKSVICILMFCFTIMSEILPKIGIKVMVSNIVVYNIFIFRALPFYLLGIWLRENDERLVELICKTNRKKIYSFIIIGFMISIVERVIFVESQFYVGTYIAIILIFLICMAYPQGYNTKIQYIGKELSMYVYIIHISIMEIFEINYPKEGQNMLIGFIEPVIVIVLSLLCAQGICMLKKRIDK